MQSKTVNHAGQQRGAYPALMEHPASTLTFSGLLYSIAIAPVTLLFSTMYHNKLPYLLKIYCV